MGTQEPIKISKEYRGTKRLGMPAVDGVKALKCVWECLQMLFERNTSERVDF